MNTGVYTITHKETGKCYIGSTRRSFALRWYNHKTLLRNGKHHSRYLQNAWNKYGEEAFDFAVLIECAPNEAIANEQRAISEYNPVFNVTKVLDQTLTFTVDDETRAIMSRKKRDAAPKHLVNGELLTLADIAERYNIPKHRLIRRAMRGITGNALLGKKRTGREGEGKKHFVRGELLDVIQISEKYEVPPATVRKRIELGWEGDSLATPVVAAEKRYFNHKGNKQMKRYLVHGEMLTLTEIANKYSLPKPTVCRRIKCGVTGDDLATPPTPFTESIKKATETFVDGVNRHLVYGENLSAKEISEKYGIKHSTVRRRIAKGWVGNQLASPVAV